MESVKIGNCPWDREDLLSKVEEFHEIYQNRPIKDNHGGMKAPQMFSAWFVMNWFKPDVIIESGVWYGQGTWFFEQASPDSYIVCIDPAIDRIQYKSEKAYYTPYDFSVSDWSSIPKENAICFFDDHQNAFERIVLCETLGFNKLIFEDNYPVGQGDCVSLKTILDTDFIDYSNKELDKSKVHIMAHYQDLTKHLLKTYYEFPPALVNEKTRWGDDWSNYPTPKPLFTFDELAERGLESYIEDYQNYTWICYAEV
tara:strand:- start:1778 stop:2542 length:765 start_codon:yes stop_codon:yes gene_type:complete